MKALTFNETRDFPYYKNNPRIPKIGWAILLLAVPISFLLYMIIGLSSEFLGSVAFCFTMLIPLLYFSNWDYKLIFQKPDRNEIILAILMFAGYMIYATVMGYVLDMFHLAGTDIASSRAVNLEMTVSLIFSMMGEELLKFIPLMFFMRLIYKFTGNRKLSLIISIILVLTCFGLIHYDPATSTIISVLLIQGLGSIFEVYGYIKTKNLFVPYISHLLTDAIIFIIILLGIT
ncbi:type II CAAX prenyl endopeptidase Rce1 family protein [Methanobrevibacter sp.]|uniref:CPBP family glutamic-type intramembrane protease n=1 Tax=Methanobrevibacter sp. TaxID=66852 RepID=UPI003870CDFD